MYKKLTAYFQQLQTQKNLKKPRLTRSSIGVLLPVAILSTLLITHLVTNKNYKDSIDKAHADTVLSIPTGLVATINSATSATISWNPVSGATGYNISRAGQYLTTVEGTGYTDNTLLAGQTYVYAVSAFDNASNFSGNAYIAIEAGCCVLPPDTLAPSKPTGLVGEVLSDSSIRVSWLPSTDNYGGTIGYNIGRVDKFLESISGTSYTDTGLTPGTVYTYSINAYDASGNQSGYTVISMRTTGGPVQTPTFSLSGYSMVFNDEFNGTSLDFNKWNNSFPWGPDTTINNEMQYYPDIKNNPSFPLNPFVLSDGNLIIRASKTPPDILSLANNKNYISGLITSRESFNTTYGSFVMRAKVPQGQGMWPAFWFFPSSYSSGKAPEIDIMEILGHDPYTSYMSWHHTDYNNPAYNVSTAYVGTTPFSNGYHTYAVEWSPGLIVWFIDDIERHRYIDSNNDFAENLYLVAALAVGGSWPGAPDNSSVFPSDYKIDYIRAYKKNAPTPSPTITPTPTPDTLKPTVSITYPLNGSKIKRNRYITVKANASDNIAVTKVEFYNNNTLICTDALAPYQCKMFTHNQANTTVTYKAQAYDSAGNNNSHSINIITTR